MSTAKLKQWLNTPEDLDIEAILIDGIHFADHSGDRAGDYGAKAEEDFLDCMREGRQTPRWPAPY